MDDIDFLNSAEMLVEQYGEKAAQVAAEEVHRFQKMGDGIGMGIWVGIMIAIFELTNGEADEDEPSDRSSTPMEPKWSRE